jgi:N-methylhydantoinase B/oxoprolinase/acetone carboxylase alpha subunit|tara:strand:+ start:3571 stop:3723 length:153 start_codon:yes stop_codon:yes gene_type:complete
MDSNTREKVESALTALKETAVSYILMVQDDHGVAIFSNDDGDRLYIVEKE